MNAVNNTFNFTINDKPFVVSCEIEYLKEGNNISPFMLLNAFDKMDIQNGTKEVHRDAISSLLLVGDVCAYAFVGNLVEMINNFAEHDTVKEVLAEEDVKFVASMVRYLNWAGCLSDKLVDVAWPLQHAVENYVSENWSEENRNAFFAAID